MLMQEKVEVVLNNINIKRYKELGYDIPFRYDNRGRKVSRGETILVKVCDVTKNNSKIEIKVKCDYCENVFFQKIINYNNSHKEIEKDCCSCVNCKKLKTKDVLINRYGTVSMKYRSEIQGFKLGRNKLNIEDVYDLFLSKDLIPMFEAEYYQTCTEKLPYKCKKHMSSGIQYITYDSLKHCKFGCSYCGNENANNNKRYSFEFVEELFKNKDYSLLSHEYFNVDQKLEFICNIHKDKGVQITNVWNVLDSINNCKYCRYEAQSGEKHSNWKGGITSEGELVRKSQEYIDWRNTIYKKYDYTCQACNIKGGSLNAHHILNFAEYKDIRLNLDNGIALCDTCHNPIHKNSFHNLYGTRNNTPEQLDEFIKYKQGKIKLEDLKLNKK